MGLSCGMGCDERGRHVFDFVVACILLSVPMHGLGDTY